MAKRINHHLNADSTPKTGYTTRRAAADYRQRVADRSGADINSMTIYTCTRCGLLHVGRARPRKGTKDDYSRYHHIRR